MALALSKSAVPLQAGRWSLWRPAPLLAAGDVLALLVAFALAGAISTLGNGLFPDIIDPARRTQMILERFGAVSLFGLLLMLWFDQHGHYRHRVPFWTELKQITLAVMLAALVDSFVLYLLHDPFSRLWLILTWVFAGLFLLGGRKLAKALLDRAGLWQLPTVVVGSGEGIAEAIAALNSEPGLGYNVTGVIDLRGRPEQPLQPFYTQMRPGFVVVAGDPPDFARTQQVVRELQSLRLPFAIVPPLSGMSVLGLRAQYFFCHDVVLLIAPNNLANVPARAIKRAFDLLVSSLLLLALSPFFLVVSAIIRSDGGSAFFPSRRIGQNGRTIWCLKFRTMVADAEQRLADLLARDAQAAEEWRTSFKLRKDPRITPLGHFLRRTSLDELPQLINVLKGEMSLVGPRPILPDEVQEYGDQIAYYFQVTPGITGLWQVSGRSGLDYRRRIALNTWYVKNWSLWHDITILIKTIRVVFAAEGAY